MGHPNPPAPPLRPGSRSHGGAGLGSLTAMVTASAVAPSRRVYRPAAAVPQGVGGQFGDHQGECLNPLRGHGRGQTFSEGAGDVPGAGDVGGAVALDHGGGAGGRRARLRVAHALPPRPGSVVPPGSACARRPGLQPGTALFRVYPRKKYRHHL